MSVFEYGQDSTHLLLIVASSDTICKGYWAGHEEWHWNGFSVYTTQLHSPFDCW
jgi:hypothetical protein